MHTHHWPQDLVSQLVISEATSAYGSFPLLCPHSSPPPPQPPTPHSSLFRGCFYLSQNDSQTLQTMVLTRPKEWCRGRRGYRRKKDEIVLLNKWTSETWVQRALQGKYTGNSLSSRFETVFHWGKESKTRRSLLESCTREVPWKLNSL